MAKKFSELQKKMSPESRARMEARYKALPSSHIMKVLRHVCRGCANIQFFAVEVLTREGVDPDATRHAECPFCGAAITIVYDATELDMEEVGEMPDLEAISDAIARAGRKGG